MKKGHLSILTGLMLMIGAFVGVVVMCYLLIFGGDDAGEELTSLKAQVVHLEAEKSRAEEEAAQAKSGLALKEVIEYSESVHDDGEKKRAEGRLWVDRKMNTAVVTLGAVNGLEPGSRLGVYENDRRVGSVEIETLLDGISYVEPVGLSLDELSKGIYRVVKE